MIRAQSRRAFLATVPVVALAGCVGGQNSGDDEAGSDETAAPDDSADDEGESSDEDDEGESDEDETDSEDDTADDEDETDALEAPLPALVAAEDRAEFAEENDIEYRNGEVEVELERDPDCELPEYIVEVVTEYVYVVVAYVDIDDLEALADDRNVFVVRPKDDPEMADRKAQVDRLPERRPITNQLVNLFLAEDREAFLEERDFNHENGTVQVNISLEPDGEPPVEYLPEEYSAYGDTVIAYVAVDDLVQLAIDENVRRVSQYIDPVTHDDQ